MVHHELIVIEDNESITLKNLGKWLVYHDLFDVQFLNLLPNYSFVLQEIERMVDNGELKIANTLFSTQETEYLSFCLNDKKFTNGYELRNKYAHGKGGSEAEMKTDYRRLLYILTVIIAKIGLDLKTYKILSEVSKRAASADCA